MFGERSGFRSRFRFSSRKNRARAAFLLAVLAVTVLAGASWSAVRTRNAPAAKPAPGHGIFRTLTGADAFAAGSFDRVTLDEDGALVLDPDAGLRSGHDRAGRYNGGSFLFGTYVSPVWETGVPVDSVVASWSAETPAGTWLEVEARARQADGWTKYYSMGVWASGTEAVRRHNSGPQEDADGLVDTDDLRLKRGASAVQLRVALFTTDPALTPRLRRLSVTATGDGPGRGTASASPYRRAWGRDLPVPERRQNDFPGGGGWCSPTSVSMIMAYWAARTGNEAWDRPVPEVAAGVRDHEYGGTGNWVFNTAYAAGLGLDAYVTRFDSLTDLEWWIAAGVPVAVNIEFEEGGLDGAPMPSSDGHIIVIRGFDRRGNPIVNDPAARADQGEEVRIVYDRAQLERAWQGRPRGTTYIIHPPGYPTP